MIENLDINQVLWQKVIREVEKKKKLHADNADSTDFNANFH